MDYHSLKRKELQSLCKKYKIKANMTNLAMADALSALNLVDGVENTGKPMSDTPVTSRESESKSQSDLTDNEPGILVGLAGLSHAPLIEISSDSEDSSGTEEIIPKTSAPRACQKEPVEKIVSKAKDNNNGKEMEVPVITRRSTRIQQKYKLKKTESVSNVGAKHEAIKLYVEINVEEMKSVSGVTDDVQQKSDGCNDNISKEEHDEVVSENVRESGVKVADVPKESFLLKEQTEINANSAEDEKDEMVSGNASSIMVSNELTMLEKSGDSEQIAPDSNVNSEDGSGLIMGELCEASTTHASGECTSEGYFASTISVKQSNSGANIADDTSKCSLLEEKTQTEKRYGLCYKRSLHKKKIMGECPSEDYSGSTISVKEAGVNATISVEEAGVNIADAPYESSLLKEKTQIAEVSVETGDQPMEINEINGDKGTLEVEGNIELTAIVSEAEALYEDSDVDDGNGKLKCDTELYVAKVNEVEESSTDTDCFSFEAIKESVKDVTDNLVDESCNLDAQPVELEDHLMENEVIEGKWVAHELELNVRNENEPNCLMITEVEAVYVGGSSPIAEKTEKFQDSDVYDGECKLKCETRLYDVQLTEVEELSLDSDCFYFEAMKDLMDQVMNNSEAKNCIFQCANVAAADFDTATICEENGSAVELVIPDTVEENRGNSGDTFNESEDSSDVASESVIPDTVEQNQGNSGDTVNESEDSSDAVEAAEILEESNAYEVAGELVIPDTVDENQGNSGDTVNESEDSSDVIEATENLEGSNAYEVASELVIPDTVDENQGNSGDTVNESECSFDVVEAAENLEGSNAHEVASELVITDTVEENQGNSDDTVNESEDSSDVVGAAENLEESKAYEVANELVIPDTVYENQGNSGDAVNESEDSSDVVEGSNAYEVASELVIPDTVEENQGNSGDIVNESEDSSDVVEAAENLEKSNAYEVASEVECQIEIYGVKVSELEELSFDSDRFYFEALKDLTKEIMNNHGAEDCSCHIQQEDDCVNVASEPYTATICGAGVELSSDGETCYEEEDDSDAEEYISDAIDEGVNEISDAVSTDSVVNQTVVTVATSTPTATLENLVLTDIEAVTNYEVEDQTLGTSDPIAYGSEKFQTVPSVADSDTSSILNAEVDGLSEVATPSKRNTSESQVEGIPPMSSTKKKGATTSKRFIKVMHDRKEIDEMGRFSVRRISKVASKVVLEEKENKHENTTQRKLKATPLCKMMERLNLADTNNTGVKEQLHVEKRPALQQLSNNSLVHEKEY